MTGSQQSGAGGNPWFGTLKKSVGSASKSKGAATPSPGKMKPPSAERGAAEAVGERGEPSDVIERSDSAAPRA